MIVGSPRRRNTANARPASSVTNQHMTQATTKPQTHQDDTHGEAKCNRPSATCPNAHTSTANIPSTDNENNVAPESIVLESWVEYIKRTTRQAESLMHKHVMSD